MLHKLQPIIAGLKYELGYQLRVWQYKRNLPQLDAGDRLIVNTLKKEGAYITNLEELGLSSTAEMLKAAQEQLAQMSANSKLHLSNLPYIYTVTDIQQFANWAKETRLMKIAENYLGLPVTFQGVHLRKDLPNEDQFGTLLWHKDSEDRKMVKIIIYLNDVDEEQGPFEYIPLHLTSFPNRNAYRIDKKLKQSGYLGLNDEQVAEIIPKSAWKSCPGPAGTVLIADPRTALHHGTLRTKERSALFFVYTANPPKRPELCTQYWDDTFARPDVKKVPV
ncbi:phytanoyl-CoA dioxygenase family protein [Anabaena azotica]|uniref:Phytanoyl-CoA dioxygenase family protein n=1 Tax=Anabaena azotica FACHB-119 TaxID=947527 RepID=A0ABR8CZI0_9NOST|nr:phytanoyl-CoA dioxygenase family protein [Anabaena azotica]MBD2499573.1 phytanoyl-CoA dioxygenase family protein [Anabaena azotica FACHB-119]